MSARGTSVAGGLTLGLVVEGAGGPCILVGYCEHQAVCAHWLLATALLATVRVRRLPAAGEGTYRLNYGSSGSRVVFVVSEPITASSSDWVAVRLRQQPAFLSGWQPPADFLGDLSHGLSV